MDTTSLKTTLATPIFTNSDGTTALSVGTVAAVALGAMALWFSIPSRKRKNLFN